MLPYADVCCRELTYADVCCRMLTYATYAVVCSRMLTYADVPDSLLARRVALLARMECADVCDVW